MARAPQQPHKPHQPQTPKRVGPRDTVPLVVVACLAGGVLSLMLLPSNITYDPYSWAIWAREIIHLNLATDAGPAWKPLPVVVDVFFAPFGRAEPWLWLLVARAGALLSLVMVYRLAQRVAGRAAGVIAVVGLLLSSSFLDYLAPFGMSEPLLAGLALLAVERHLDEHHGQAYGLIYACLLLRPEAFLFFAGYSVFLWRHQPRARPWVVVLTALLPAFWLLPDYLSTGDWLRSTRRAEMPTQRGPRLSAFPAGAVLVSQYNTVVAPAVVGALAAIAIAARRFTRERKDTAVIALSVLGLAWLAEVAVTTEAGASAGDERYLIVSVAILCVLAGIGWVRLVPIVRAGIARAWRPYRTDRTDSTDRPGSQRRAGKAAITLAVLVSVPFVFQRVSELSGSIGEVPYQAQKYQQLDVLIARAGGRARILACPPVSANIYQIPALAWALGLHQADLVIVAGPRGTPIQGRIVQLPRAGTTFRTRTTRGTWTLPAVVGPTATRVLAATSQWQVLSTC